MEVKKTKSLVWAPLPDGRAWWPAILIKNPEMFDNARFAKTLLDLWNSQSPKCDVEKDGIVLLYGVVSKEFNDKHGSGGHRFAIVPLASLRPYDFWLKDFSAGLCASGKNMGQPISSSEEKLHLKQVCARIQSVFHPKEISPPPPPPPLPPPSSVSRATTSIPVSVVVPLPPPPPPPPAPQEVEDVEYAKLLQRHAQLKQMLAVAQRKVAQSPVKILPTPSVCKGLGTQTLRNWDFCSVFREELNMFTNLPFPCLASFDASLDNPDCWMFAEICCQLTNYLSLHANTSQQQEESHQTPPPKYVVDPATNIISFRAGSTCTRLSWQYLLESLVQQGIVALPSSTPMARALVNILVQTCTVLPHTNRIFKQRLQEYIALSKEFAEDHDEEVDFFQVESKLVLSALERKFSHMQRALALFRASKRVRNVPFANSLFLSSFDDDEQLRVFSFNSDTNQWSVFQSEAVLTKLARDLPNPRDGRIVSMVLNQFRVRFRPKTWALYHRAVMEEGWTFTHAGYLGRDVCKYVPNQGVMVARICAYHKAENKYKLVFHKKTFEEGVEMSRVEVERLIYSMDHPGFHQKYFLGDFQFHSDDFPKIVGAGDWVPEVSHSDVLSALVMVACPEKKIIALGVIVARSEDGDFALVLADGGEIVVLNPRAIIARAQQQALGYSPNPSCPLFHPIDRFRPLYHHSGEPVGFQGVVSLFHKNLPINTVEELRRAILDFEEMYRASLWEVPEKPEDEEQQRRFGEVWVKFVRQAESVAALGFALESLADIMAKRPPSSSNNSEDIGGPSSIAESQGEEDEEEEDGNNGSNEMSYPAGGGESHQEATLSISNEDQDFDNMNEELLGLEMLLQQESDEFENRPPKEMRMTTEEEIDDVAVVAKEENESQLLEERTLNRPPLTSEEMQQVFAVLLDLLEQVQEKEE